MKRFSRRSLKNLAGVRPELVLLAGRALVYTDIDFVVIEGLRTLERQRRLFDLGATWTLNSKHLDGQAIDVAAWVDGDIRWDWPLYEKIFEAFEQAGIDYGIHFTWGGDWKKYRDGPHFELFG